MKKLSTLLLTFMVAGSFAQTKWTIDKAHSTIGFSVTHMAISETDGKFTDFDATVTSTKDDFDGASVEFTAKVASIDTDNEKRDGHLKSDDFFNAEKFPDIKFKGKLVKKSGKYKLEGDLTMRDVTKKVSLDVTYGGTIDTGHGVKAGFKVNGTVNRQEYGLKWSSTLSGGELAVGDDVTLSCKIELNKA